MNPEASRKLILGFALLAAVFFLAVVWFRPWLALGVLFISHLLILYPTLVANCQCWGPVITHFETPRREVWLTIDDGPHPLHTPRVLEILERFGAKATFFVIGKRASEFPDQIEAIRAAGHEIANHTATHPSATGAIPKPTPIEYADQPAALSAAGPATASAIEIANG